MAQSKRPQDHYGKRARKEGYPARSIYKLEEIDRRVQLLRMGQRVLDLGAHPGSWSLYASQKVGPRGRVLGIDLQEHVGALPPNVEMRVGDALVLDAESLGETFDIVLSDMAPATTGHRALDQVRSQELFLRAVAVSERTLIKGGHFVGKIFQSGDFPLAKAAVQKAFDKVRIIRPDAVRKESFEIYVVGLGRKG